MAAAALLKSDWQVAYRILVRRTAEQLVAAAALSESDWQPEVAYRRSADSFELFVPCAHSVGRTQLRESCMLRYSMTSTVIFGLQVLVWMHPSRFGRAAPPLPMCRHTSGTCLSRALMALWRVAADVRAVHVVCRFVHSSHVLKCHWFARLAIGIACTGSDFVHHNNARALLHRVSGIQIQTTRNSALCHAYWCLGQID